MFWVCSRVWVRLSMTGLRVSQQHFVTTTFINIMQHVTILVLSQQSIIIIFYALRTDVGEYRASLLVACSCISPVFTKTHARGNSDNVGDVLFIFLFRGRGNLLLCNPNIHMVICMCASHLYDSICALKDVRFPRLLKIFEILIRQSNKKCYLLSKG